MREARIILPKTDNNGLPIDLIHTDLANKLVRRFGGLSRSEVMGMWASPNGFLYQEAGYAYDVAMEPSEKNNGLLRDIAYEAGRMAGQEAVYIRYPDGNVEILTIQHEERAEAA